MHLDRSERAARRRMAEDICVLYHEAVRAEVAVLTKGGRHRKPSCGMDDVDASARRAFRRAARIAIEEGADAREYVVAQFAMWRSASAYHKKFLLPSPQQMCSAGARVRYLQHKASTEVRKARVVVADDDQPRSKRFYVEERTLRGLARVQRSDPADVLAEQPERFSREFLVHKRVWDAVKDTWQERQHT